MANPLIVPANHLQVNKVKTQNTNTDKKKLDVAPAVVGNSKIFSQGTKKEELAQGIQSNGDVIQLDQAETVTDVLLAVGDNDDGAVILVKALEELGKKVDRTLPARQLAKVYLRTKAEAGNTEPLTLDQATTVEQVEEIIKGDKSILQAILTQRSIPFDGRLGIPALAQLVLDSKDQTNTEDQANA